jgi:hypothetical protein
VQEVPQKKELTVKKRLIQLLHFHLPPLATKIQIKNERKKVLAKNVVSPAP